MSQQQRLHALAQDMRQRHLYELFSQEQQRFERLSVQHEQIIFDFSKQRLNDEILDELIGFAKAKQLDTWIERLFSQQKINYTEQRAAMHWALRLPEYSERHQDLSTEVHAQLQRMFALVEQIHAGQYRGVTGQVIQDVVNIGVGGSDLGPMMVSHALADFKHQTAKVQNQ